MNIDKLKWVRGLIAVPLASQKGLGFDMATFWSGSRYGEGDHICGTAACIAGTAIIETMSEEQYFNWLSNNESWCTAFSKILECTQKEADLIALPRYDDKRLAGMKDDYRDWTREDAVKWINYWIAHFEKAEADG